MLRVCACISMHNEQEGRSNKIKKKKNPFWFTHIKYVDPDSGKSE